jgi:hypothetical protein
MAVDGTKTRQKAKKKVVDPEAEMRALALKLAGM